MTYDCGSCLVKYVLCIFNFVIFLVGSVVLSIGIWLLADKNSFIGLARIVPVDNIEEFTSPGVIEQASYILLTIGTIMLLISFLGYCGALRESRCMLVLYGLLLLAILILEIAAFVLAVTNKANAEQQTKLLLKSSLRKYYNSTDHKDAITLAWNSLQTNLKCCGVDNYQDYQENKVWQEQNNVIPPSCCALDDKMKKPLDNSCILKPTETNSYFTKGCYQKIMEWVMSNLNKIIITAAILGSIEILGVIFAFCLSASVGTFK